MKLRIHAVLLGAAFLAGLGAALWAADPATTTAPAEKPRLTLALFSRLAEVAINPAQQGKAFRDSLEALKKAGREMPQPPAIDLTLTLTNNSDKDITLTLDGDASRVELKLEGPGAVTVENNVAMTMEFRVGTPVTIAPGKSREIKLTSLAFGSRGISEAAYWTEPGDYTLKATLIYAEGETPGEVTSDALKIKVVTRQGG